MRVPSVNSWLSSVNFGEMCATGKCEIRGIRVEAAVLRVCVRARGGRGGGEYQ